MAHTNQPTSLRVRATDSEGWTPTHAVRLVILILVAEYAFMAYAFPTAVLGTIAAELQTTQAIWVVAAFLIGAAAVTPLLGRLGDLFGKKRILQLMLTGGIVGAVVVAVAPNFGVVIAGRAIQGLALGLPFMNASLVRDIFPTRIQSVATALVVTGAGVVSVVASLALAPVISTFGWRGVFWVPAVYALAVLIVLTVFVPETTLRAEASRLDTVGAALLAIAVTLLLVPISLGSEWGWTSPLTVGFFASGLLMMAIWITQALRTKFPVISLRQFAYPPLAITFMFAFVGIAVSPAIYSFWSFVIATPASAGLGYGLGLAAESVTIFTAIFSLGSFLGGLACGIALRRLSPGTVALFTFLLSTVGYTVTAFSLTHAIAFGIGAFVLAIGSGGAYAIVYNLIARVVVPERQASSAAAVTLGTNIGGAVFPVAIFAVLNGTASSIDGALVYGVEWMRFAFLAPAVFLALMTVLALALSLYQRRHGLRQVG